MFEGFEGFKSAFNTKKSLFDEKSIRLVKQIESPFKGQKSKKYQNVLLTKA